MRDLEIRYALRRHLESAFADDDGALILDEVGICCGSVRVDMAVVNGELKGFEIKSDRDTLHRLSAQCSGYGKVFDTLTIVVGSRHLDRAQVLIPQWCGILLAQDQGNNELNLHRVRRDEMNSDIDPSALVQLLWRDEALSLLRAHNLDRGLSCKPRRYLWEALTKNLTVRTLRDLVRTQLKARRQWRVGLRPLQDGAKSRPFAKSSSSPSRRFHLRTHRYIGRPS